MLQATWDWYYGSSEEELLSGCQFGDPYSKVKNKGQNVTVRPGTYENGDAVNIFTVKLGDKSETNHLEVCAKVSQFLG